MTYYPHPGQKFCTGTDCHDRFMIAQCDSLPDNLAKQAIKIGCLPQSPRKRNCFRNTNERYNNGG